MTSVVVLKTSLGDAHLELTAAGYNDQVVEYFRETVCRSVGGGRFERVQRGFAAQYTIPGLSGEPFDPPRSPKNKHSKAGTVGVAVVNGRLAPGFYVTLGERVKHLDEIGYVIGHMRSENIVQLLSRCLVDSRFSPLKAPVVFSAVLDGEEVGRRREEVGEPTSATAVSDCSEDKRWEREQRLKLQLLGDRRAGSLRDPKDIRTAFVAQLSPHTKEEDVEIVFSRFGPVTDCQVVRKPGRAATFAFVQFERQEDCDEAVRKMDGVILDDRRIRVDYSHSR